MKTKGRYEGALGNIVYEGASPLTNWGMNLALESALYMEQFNTKAATSISQLKV